MRNLLIIPAVLLALTLNSGCQPQESTDAGEETGLSEMDSLLAKYTTVRLTTDLSKLSDNEKKMIPLLIEAAQLMDECFWYEAYGDKEALLGSIEDEATRRFAQ
ncbi:MAG: hypothetical protein KDC30_20635, partial [Saprospiraceae bacterium]|nr:hypothetical protein [Saprospiraceae bacterium]